MNSRVLPFIFSTLLWLSLSSCDQLTEKAGKPQDAGKKSNAERPDHAVEIITVTRQSVRIKRTLTGTLEAPRTVHVHSEQSGRIIELPFYEGDAVKAAGVLVRLDDALLRAAFAKVVATRKQAGVDLTRLQNLVPRKLATEDELARASTALELAQAEESLQQILLSRAVIRAPFAAIVSERLKEPNDIVAINEHILTLFDPAVMTALVQVPEQLHSRVAVGDAVEVRIDSLGDRSFSARILRIHPVLNAQTRQGAVEIQLQSVPQGARPGQLCRVTLETAETLRRLIPLNALQFDTRGSFVYRLDADSKAMRVAVVTGLQMGESIEIIEGVNDGDKIVSRGFLGLKSGKTVRVVNPPASTSLHGGGWLQTPA
ncbi:MAG: efflux RND transporter periplasmic adaptor subunit [Gammaproteobacteria bacterium]|nr:efflux RND transporter periplasmic adaptor subunit [Gammaproteobacteria bacterium]